MRKTPVPATRQLFIHTVIVFFLAAALSCTAPATCRAAETFLPTFGEGKIKVRLYTDYFCPPCREMEPGLEPIISELVANRIITLTFADTPFHTYSSLYVRYFLYAINEKKDFGHALYVRRSLIEASRNNVVGREKIEAFLKEKNINLKPFDPKATFDVMSRRLQEDRVETTPLCLIEIDGKTTRHRGAGNVIDALDKLRQQKPRQ